MTVDTLTRRRPFTKVERAVRHDEVLLRRAERLVAEEFFRLRLSKYKRLRRRVVTPKELYRDHLETVIEVIDQPEYHYPLGLLARYGYITPVQLETGNDYAQLIWDHRKVIEAPGLRVLNLAEIEMARAIWVAGGSGEENGLGSGGFLPWNTGVDGDGENKRAKFSAIDYDSAGFPHRGRFGAPYNTFVKPYTQAELRRANKLPAVWRRGYAQFRRGGAPLYCAPPTDDIPDSPFSRRIEENARGAREVLLKQGRSVYRVVRRMCEDDNAAYIHPTELADLKRGLDALRIFFTRSAA
jgi:hypothetical protein